MGLFGNKEEKQQKAIQEFWEWFLENRLRFSNLQSLDHRLINDLGSRLNKVEKGLVFQIGQGDQGKVLEISADGIRDLFPAVRKVVDAAPNVEGWRILAFRQPARDASDIVLEFNGNRLSPADMLFTSRSSGNRARIVVYVPTVLHDVPKDLVGAAFIILDAILGEYAVETKITIDGFQSTAQAPMEARHLTELPGVLLDVPGDPI